MVEKRYGQRHKGMQDENNLRETPTPGTPRCPRRMGGDVSGHQTAWETAPRPLCPSPGRPQTWSPARPTGVPHSLRGRRPKNWRHDCHGRKPPHVPQRRRKRPFWTRPEPSHVGHRRCRTIRSPNSTDATTNGTHRATEPMMTSADGPTSATTGGSDGSRNQGMHRAAATTRRPARLRVAARPPRQMHVERREDTPTPAPPVPPPPPPPPSPPWRRRPTSRAGAYGRRGSAFGTAAWS